MPGQRVADDRLNVCCEFASSCMLEVPLEAALQARSSTRHLPMLRLRLCCQPCRLRREALEKGKEAGKKASGDPAVIPSGFRTMTSQ